MKNIAIVGAGLMGQGISQWFVQAGCRVELADVNLENAKKAVDKIYSSWDRLVLKKKFHQHLVDNFKDNIKPVGQETLNPDADLLIEAVIEEHNLKVDLFKISDLHFNPKTIFSTNTSSLPVSKLAAELPDSRKIKFIGLHFFNPAVLMRLIEIVKTPWTDTELLNKMVTFFEERKKVPVLCKDSPAMIVNRVNRPFYSEALHMLEKEGQNSSDENKIREIDLVLREVGGFPLGPFQLMDLIGVDSNLRVTQTVFEQYHYADRFRPSNLQKHYVDTQRTGKKTGEGFYHYE